MSKSNPRPSNRLKAMFSLSLSLVQSARTAQRCLEVFRGLQKYSVLFVFFTFAYFLSNPIQRTDGITSVLVCSLFAADFYREECDLNGENNTVFAEISLTGINAIVGYLCKACVQKLWVEMRIQAVLLLRGIVGYIHCQLIIPLPVTPEHPILGDKTVEHTPTALSNFLLVHGNTALPRGTAPAATPNKEIVG